MGGGWNRNGAPLAQDGTHAINTSAIVMRMKEPEKPRKGNSVVMLYTFCSRRYVSTRALELLAEKETPGRRDALSFSGRVWVFGKTSPPIKAVEGTVVKQIRASGAYVCCDHADAGRESE